MFVKKKHIQVVFFSSAIITAVFVSTLVGYSFYVQWKKDTFSSRYRHSIYKLTADLFEKDITFSNIAVKSIGGQSFSKGSLIEGALKNNTGKTITSLLVKVNFITQDGAILYSDWFYPLQGQNFEKPPVSFEAEGDKNLLPAGESITFRHRLKNCSAETASRLSKDSSLSKKQSKDKMKIVCSVIGLSVS